MQLLLKGHKIIYRVHQSGTEEIFTSKYDNDYGDYGDYGDDDDDDDDDNDVEFYTPGGLTSRDMPDLESDEYAGQRRNQQGQGLKIRTLDQMLVRLSISLAQFTAKKVSAFGVVLVPLRENPDQNNSEYGHFLHSD